MAAASGKDVLQPTFHTNHLQHMTCSHQFSAKSLQPIGPRHRNSHWGSMRVIFTFFAELHSIDLKLSCSYGILV